jgi:hypothetical protein
MRFRTIKDLYFDLIDLGFELSIPGHPDDWPTIERLQPKELIWRSMSAEIELSEKMEKDSK